MTNQFKREERYYVFKISDMRKHLSQEKFELVGSIAEKLNAGRAVDGKKSLQAVVVEHDWPEYERVWQMIETRMTTTRAQPFKPNNDRRFWPIPLSRVKGKNGTPKPLRCLCSCGTNYRVEVNEWHCPRCGKKCQITQQPDLSNLQPETQQQIRKWIADGTFTERAVGVMLEHEREIRETKQDEDHLINQRDHAHEIIDKLCDAVLGTDRHERSSAYFFEDAVNEVEEKIAALEKQEPKREPLTDEINRLRKALVYVSHALHATPKHMLAKGVTLIDGDAVRVSIDGWVVEASNKNIEASHGIKEQA